MYAYNAELEGGTEFMQEINKEYGIIFLPLLQAAMHNSFIKSAGQVCYPGNK